MASFTVIIEGTANGTSVSCVTVVVRYVGATRDASACTIHWTRTHRELNTFCACPLHVHSKELHRQNISEVVQNIRSHRENCEWLPSW